MTDDAPDNASDGGTGPVGERIDRREDAALLTGAATFTDDIAPSDLAVLTFARSEHAHADVRGVDTAAAESMDGVVAVYTWDDVAASEIPGVLPVTTHGLDCDPPGHPILARDRVRYQGQPVAAVVAEDRYRARDAADAVETEYGERPAVVDQRAAQSPDAPTVYEDAPDNVAGTWHLGDADVADAAVDAADHVVELDLTNNRLIPTALEPRAAVARWDTGDQRLTVEMTSQSPHGHRGKFSTSLGLPERAVRVVAPAVGGGFGHKGHHYPGEATAAFAAMNGERPVGWTATRSENYLAGTHGRDHRTTAELGLDEDGTIRGLRVETDANVGAYGLGSGLTTPSWYGSLLAGQYDVPAIHCETRAVFTNTAPIHSYRGAGRPEANYIVERCVGAAARELGLDPVDVRRRNQVAEFPHETPVGATYDSGDYETGLDKALEAADWSDLRHRPDRDDDGRYRGVGLACYVESTGGGHESGVVRAHPDGTVTVSAGTHSHGQGHATTYAQIVADELGIDDDAIDVQEGDSDATPTGTGTFGSRSTITGGNAVAESARRVREKARRLATERLGVTDSAVEYDDGVFAAPGRTDETCTFAEAAETAYGWDVPTDTDPGLEATTFYEQDGTAWTFGTHVVAVAVDAETGTVDIERYVALDDCGERINPTIVEGQVQGGVTQGIGQARYENAVYADDGTLETDSMLDYAVPRAGGVPEIQTEATVTPSPTNDLGVKGIGEAGAIAAPPAVVNAVCDALEPLGVDHIDMPLTEERVWRAVRDAGE